MARSSTHSVTHILYPSPAFPQGPLPSTNTIPRRPSLGQVPGLGPFQPLHAHSFQARRLQLAPPASRLRPEGMPVCIDLRLFSTLVIYLCLFSFLGILRLGSIVYAATEYTCTHTQDQGWGRRGPNSSQEGSELVTSLTPRHPRCCNREGQEPLQAPSSVIFH